MAYSLSFQRVAIPPWPVSSSFSSFAGCARLLAAAVPAPGITHERGDRR